MKQIKELASLLRAEQSNDFDKLSDAGKIDRICQSIKVRGERTFNVKEYKHYIKQIDDFSLEATALHNAFASYYKMSNLKRRNYLTYLVIYNKMSSASGSVLGRAKELSKIFCLEPDTISKKYVTMEDLFSPIEKSFILRELSWYKIGI